MQGIYVKKVLIQNCQTDIPGLNIQVYYYNWFFNLAVCRKNCPFTHSCSEKKSFLRIISTFPQTMNQNLAIHTRFQSKLKYH